MNGIEFHPSSAGYEEILKSAGARSAVKAAASSVADNLRSQGITVGDFHGGGEIELPVTIEDQTTDRAREVVTIAHPAGMAVQAKYGAITKAASAAGLDVRGH